MNTVRPTWREFLKIVGLNLVTGSVPALFAAASARSMTLPEFLGWAAMGCTYSNCIGLPCWLVIPSLARETQGRPAILRFVALLSTFALFAVLGCAVANTLIWPFGAFGRRPLGAILFFSVRICLLISLGVGAILFIIETLRARLDAANEELAQQRLAEERQRKMAAEARYASLESRVRPHFLFNTLNSISALVREDPAEAERMIERLAELLRFSLDSELTGLITLSEELRIVEEYLQIERVRFGTRLSFHIEVSPEAQPVMVPPLSIQTLVENSVKYAVGVQREGAEIMVEASLSNGRLMVQVRDNGPGFTDPATSKPGHGLDLLSRRLESLFGSSASLEWRTQDGFTVVSLSVPA
ncbi:MAG: hypothetical protein EBY17_04755 [Acidobacteriia bacterium]|nr:hypothetical protein [Terriglobia bacterium]